MDRSRPGILSPPAAVSLSGVRWTYATGGFSLEVERLEIAPGEAVACIGPSGCGKTTLVHLMAGILVPQTGTVELAGRPLSALSERARRARRIREIGLVLQEFELLDYLSALDNTLLPYYVTDALALDADVRERARALLSSLGLGLLHTRKPGLLSQGERQRVALCRALLPRPRLLLCDEPTGNLDPRNTDRLVDLLLARAREHGASVFMVTHDHGLLDRFDRVVEAEAFDRSQAT